MKTREELIKLFEAAYDKHHGDFRESVGAGLDAVFAEQPLAEQVDKLAALICQAYAEGASKVAKLEPSDYSAFGDDKENDDGYREAARQMMKLGAKLP